MSNLTTIIKEYAPENIVDAWYEGQYSHRSWLGLSTCGHECPRYLWYAHHNASATPPNGRILRLFKLGNTLEEEVIVDLKSAGFTITDTQKEVSFEWEETTIKGHIDGIISGLIESKQFHLLEIKTSSEKRFKELKKCGYEKWENKYKFQIHAYMLALKLNRCLAVVYNKNTSELYTERIKINKEYIVEELRKCFEAIIRQTEPERLCPRADWYKAKWCCYYQECFGL